MLHVVERLEKGEVEEDVGGRVDKGKGREVAEEAKAQVAEGEAEEVLTGEVKGAEEAGGRAKVTRSDSVGSLGSLASIAEEGGIQGVRRHHERRSSVRSSKTSRPRNPADADPVPSLTPASIFPSGPRTRRLSADTTATGTSSTSSASPALPPNSPSKASFTSSTYHSSSRPSYSATSSPHARPPPLSSLTQSTTPSNASIRSAGTGRQYPSSVRSAGTTQSQGPQSIFAPAEPRKRGMAEILAAVASKPPASSAPAYAPPPAAAPKVSRFAKLLGGGKKAPPKPGSSLAMLGGPRPGGSASILDAALMSAQAGGARVRASNMSTYHQQRDVHPDALAEALARSGVRQSAPSIMSVDSDAPSSFHHHHRHRRGSDDRSDYSAAPSSQPTFPAARRPSSTHQSHTPSPGGSLAPPVPGPPSGADRSAYTGSGGAGGQRVAPSKRAPVFATRADAVFVQKKGLNEGPSRRSFVGVAGGGGGGEGAGLGLGLGQM